MSRKYGTKRTESYFRSDAYQETFQTISTRVNGYVSSDATKEGKQCDGDATKEGKQGDGDDKIVKQVRTYAGCS